MRHPSLIAMAALAALSACGRPTEDVPVKLSGVGQNPEDIGPAPKNYGGFIEYTWMDFAGGGLTLASLGLGSTDPISSDLVGFQPPYAAIYGAAFMFDNLVPAPQSHQGNIATPPPVEGQCWTNFQPFSFLQSSTADVGSKVSLVSLDGTAKMDLDRFPDLYPPNPQNIFVYYIAVNSWLPQSIEAPVAVEGEGDPFALERRVVRYRNFPHGEPVRVVFPGGEAPIEAPVSAIPVPSAALDGDVYRVNGEVVDGITLPTQPQGVMLSWSGKRWDETGAQVASEGDQSACFQFIGGATPGSPEDCLSLTEPPSEATTLQGQIYSGPWDSPDQAVTFRWLPPETPGAEKVVLNVRFLAPVDRSDPSFTDAGRVAVEGTSEIEESWDVFLSRNGLDEDTPLPQGYRPALACDPDEDVEYGFNPALIESDGEPTLALRGDPFSNLAEVSCLLADNGEFTLTMDHLADAIAYAEQNGGAGGVVFSFSRKVEAEMNVPPLRDYAGYRRETSPVVVVSNAAISGRFWVDYETTSFGTPWRDGADQP